MRRLLLAAFLGLTLAARGQQLPPAEPQSTPNFTSPDQAAEFGAAKANASAGHWDEALAKLKPMHEQHPDDLDLTRFAALAAINSGDAKYAEALLKPIVDAKPGSWQELILLARVYAETHQPALRDAALAQLIELHDSNRHPKLSAVQIFPVEHITFAEGTIDLYYSLVPWSQYKIYEMARIFNKDHQQTLRITLESSDFDQPLWAKSHEKEAAQGMRMFSMDGYSERKPAPNGGFTQTHMTFGFFDGRPTYDTVRDRIVAIATGQKTPMSSSTPGVPKQ